ncbi:MAG TPA: sigma-54-dependent Fis family transcriptional regulator [Verrucomicrobiales bacterium]|nr:sigma-54-dependent Fis family transcriptional regulator [Verrucomicrobiales bacterium]
MSSRPSTPGKELPPILIVDDDPGQRSLLTAFLRSQGFETLAAASGEEALRVLGQRAIGLMISDVRMPGLTGLETLRLARREHPTLPVLLVTAYADIREAVVAMRDGAVNYLSKPIDLDELLSSVQRAVGVTDGAPVRVSADRELPASVVARSPTMQALFRDAALIASSESRVLITGESGVGKEVLADLIHGWSPRSAAPLMKVNCAAIPENLLESELFGHERGAFTGAAQQRIGRFEAACGGTIFLDEIAEMTPQLQAKLLRVTQEGQFQRVGSNVDQVANVRLLAATNRNLEEEVRKGRFREDLYYRLNVVELNIPPLRERREDILPLAGHFLEQFTRGRARLSPGTVERIEHYSWPGNVRELRNAMERAALLSGGELILPDHLPARVKESGQAAAGAGGGGVPVPGSVPVRLEDLEQQAILEALQKHAFNRTEAAKALGISRRTLLYKLHHLRETGHRVDPE